MLTRDSLTAYRDYLNGVGLKHSTVRIWFQAVKVYIDWLANWSTLSDNKEEEYRLNRLTGIVRNIIAGAGTKNNRLIRMERTTDPSRTNPPTPYQVSQVVPKARGTASHFAATTEGRDSRCK